ncbi:MAG: cysteinyl-tRNA synthetase [Desulfobacteraceae bacterium Eth-SRB1]|nr:MAG: cysteinyl-tRNA synthetase [Desulfobacteraceae bacterium Eth-SRB1]
MTLRIYNTLNRKKEIFKPVKQGRVGMYVCGPTVYDSCHIGHARSIITFDVIVRYLKAKGYDVTHVRNFTDIDDKIINRANELGMDTRVLADKYIKEFYEDMDALNVERATIEPRATDHIDQIIKVIKRLIEKGIAYRIDNDVYYAVESFKGYGKLSGRKLKDMEAGARVEIDKRKHNPFDFALWKSSKPGEPAWDSPWGKGRPGWHIECSAMSIEYLGETFDIHGGGKDLIFPHHENEIAQSEGAFEKPFVNYWIHNGFVNINKEKMSKSLGNFLMIKDIIKKYNPEAVRLFLLSSHYRSPIDFTDQALYEVSSGLDRIYSLLDRVEKQVGDRSDNDNILQNTFWEQFCLAMDDDFNTALGIGILYDAVKNANRLLDDNKSLSEDAIKTVLSYRADIYKMTGILGIITKSPEAYFAGKKSLGLEEKSIDPEIIEKMIKDRADARKAKDWSKADQIRKELAEMNIIIEDRSEGTVWKVKN